MAWHEASPDMDPINLNLTLLRGSPFIPVSIFCFDAPDLSKASDITGWTAWAEVRSAPDETLILDLAPTISDPENGVVTLPAIEEKTTALLPDGKFEWDLILQDPSGQRLGPYVRGTFVITDQATIG